MPGMGALLRLTGASVDPARRGHIKQALVNIVHPAEDLVGYVDGEALEIHLRLMTDAGKPFALRDYQRDAADVFYARGAAHGGSGVVVLPCGAGKTIVGMATMEETQCNTLILTPGAVAVRQWIMAIFLLLFHPGCYQFSMCDHSLQ